MYSDHVTFMTVLDNNGVPRFHRQLTTASTDDDQLWALNFKYDGGGRFSVARRPQRASSQSVFGDWQIDLLDHRLQVTTSGIGTVAPLTHTDAHDFHVTAGGDYGMLSYDRSTRDFSPYGGSAATSTRDSVIQRRTAAGVSQFTWNSWDHRAALQVGDDCRVGLYPDSYHVQGQPRRLELPGVPRTGKRPRHPPEPALPVGSGRQPCGRIAASVRRSGTPDGRTAGALLFGNLLLYKDLSVERKCRD